MSVSRDLLSLEELCPHCRGRGTVTGRYCTCPAGAYLSDRDHALQALAAFWGPREAQRWLEDIHPKTRERRLYMLRDGRSEQVFAEIRKEQANRGISPLLAPAERIEPKAPERAAETLQDTAKERMIADLRKAGRLDAALLLKRDRVGEMDDEDRAFYDAMLTGTGYLLDGQRIDPARIKVFRWGIRE